jgi:hypothetical protein
MKAMQSLLKVFTKNEPAQVFTAPVGKRRIKAIEQEFIFTGRDSRVADAVQVEYASKRPALTAGRGKHYIQVKEASSKFRLAVRTIQQLCHDGKVECRRQGRGENSAWLIVEESLRAYLDAQGA